jgi:hypothetical protein
LFADNWVSEGPLQQQQILTLDQLPLISPMSKYNVPAMKHILMNVTIGTTSPAHLKLQPELFASLKLQVTKTIGYY